MSKPKCYTCLFSVCACGGQRTHSQGSALSFHPVDPEAVCMPSYLYFGLSIHISVCWSVLCAICLPIFVPHLFIHTPLMAVLLSRGSSVSLHVPSISLYPCLSYLLACPSPPHTFYISASVRVSPCWSGAPLLPSSPQCLPFQPSQALQSPGPPQMSHACSPAGTLCLLLLAELSFPAAVPPTSFKPLLRWCHLHCELARPPARPLLPSS